jgi:hypothetical protein
MAGMNFVRSVILTTLLLSALFLTGHFIRAEETIPCLQTGFESVATDKEDYQPEETVYITGSGYAAECSVIIRVTRPDGSIVVGDGSFAEGSDQVTADADGNFAYEYILNGVEGEYEVAVLGASGTVLARTIFTDAIPPSLGLFADSARAIPKQVFERGDTVYARATATAPDLTQKYRYGLSTAAPFGANYPGYPTACTAPDGSGNIDDQHILLQTDALSNITRWTYRLIIRGTVGCSGSTTNRDRTFFVMQAYAFTDAASRNACVSDATCGSPTPRPVVLPGSTVYLRIRGFTANRTHSAIRFRKPDNSIACATGDLVADANGALSFDYPSGSCPSITSADIGDWTIDASPEGAGFLASFTTNLDGFSVALAEVCGAKYYDSNVNGQWDVGEAFLSGWPIDHSNTVSGTTTTDGDGEFCVELDKADTYTFEEQQADSPWIQTGNTSDQSSVAPASSSNNVTLNGDKTYTVEISDPGSISGLYFGNVCVGRGNGRTLGFWSNKNGQALMNDDGSSAPELTLLATLNLRHANGTDFDPANYPQFRNWILNARATNMAYMLSAQLAAMALSVEAGLVNGASMVYAPGLLPFAPITGLNALGFISVDDLINAADAALGADGLTLSGDPNRAYQEALKDALDRANNNLTFVQASPCSFSF